MSEPSTATVPVLSTYLPRPAGIPVAPMAMQKILTKAIRSHVTTQNMRNTQVKGADKMGGKRGTSRPGKTGRTTARVAVTTKK